MRQRSQALAEDGLAVVRRRFAQWRKGRGGGRIPHELWMAAVQAANAHGAEPVAAELRVDLQRLKQWMRTLDEDGPSAAAAFVELPLLSGFAPVADGRQAPECTLEFEEPSGRRLRISLKGPATTQALELGRALWRASP